MFPFIPNFHSSIHTDTLFPNYQETGRQDFAIILEQFCEVRILLMSLLDEKPKANHKLTMKSYATSENIFH